MVKDLQARGWQAKLQLIGDTPQMQAIQAIQAGDLLHELLELGRAGWADVAHLNWDGICRRRGKTRDMRKEV